LKYLVYLLLGLNLAYFAWYQTQPTDTPPVWQLASLPSSVKPLALLSERNRGIPVAPELAKHPAEPATVVKPEPAPQAETISPTADTAAQPAAVQPPPTCWTIGPIDARTEPSDLLVRLSRQGHVATLREGKIQLPSGYQVYLPAMSAEKASEVVSTLKAAGMNDYFVGKRNRISLGIFSSKGKARIRQQRVRRLNYDALLDARYRTRKVYWIDIEGDKGTPVGSEDWKQIMANYNDIQVQQVSCE